MKGEEYLKGTPCSVIVTTVTVYVPNGDKVAPNIPSKGWVVVVGDVNIIYIYKNISDWTIE